jgi:hypothetical protein
MGQEIPEWQRGNSSGHTDRRYPVSLSSVLSFKVGRFACHSGPFFT